MLIAALAISEDTSSVLTEPVIISRGFIYMEEADGLVSQIKEKAREEAEKCLSEGLTKWSHIKKRVSSSLRSFLRTVTGRDPLIIPIILKTG